MRGPVYVPGQTGYNAARVVFNTRWDGVKPPAVVKVRDTADVRAVVKWAEKYDVPLVSRSGGHGYNGNSTSNRAVVVDLGALKGIRYADGIATIGPAAELGDVYARLAAKGVTIPAGSCPTVALGGLVLGGGMGLAGRAMGLTLDRVRSFDVVTADGPAPQARRRGPVLGAARRRRELRDRHRDPPAHPPRQHRRVLLDRVWRSRRGARALGRVRARCAGRADLDPQPHERAARPPSASTSAARRA